MIVLAHERGFRVGQPKLHDVRRAHNNFDVPGVSRVELAYVIFCHPDCGTELVIPERLGTGSSVTLSRVFNHPSVTLVVHPDTFPV